MTEHPFHRERHQLIGDLLERFNSDFLGSEGIGFGGGTRIALELFAHLGHPAKPTLRAPQ